MEEFRLKVLLYESMSLGQWSTRFFVVCDP